MLTPIRDGILFVFADDVYGEKGYFKETTEWGFEIAGDHKESANDARWGKVIAIGPDVEDDIKTGMFVYIEPMMWTEGFKHDGVSIWKTDSSKVMATADSIPK